MKAFAAKRSPKLTPTFVFKPYTITGFLPSKSVVYSHTFPRFHTSYDVRLYRSVIEERISSQHNGAKCSYNKALLKLLSSLEASFDLEASLDELSSEPKAHTRH